jgi:signal transduction histidine kinase
MAMQKSAELGEVAVLLYNELKTLGVTQPFFETGYVEIDEVNKIQTGWTSTPDGNYLEPFNLPLTGEPVLDARYEAWKQRVPVFKQLVSGEELKRTIEFTLPFMGNEEAEEITRNAPDSIIFYCGNFSHGYLNINSDTPLSAEGESLLARFTRVFEQTYTRFLDLKKAEAQSREAQIEAALERVRSRSLAMHHTNELQDVVNVAAQQLLKMNIDIDGGMFIAINDEVKDDLPFWAAAGAADYVQKVNIPFLDRKTFTGLHDAILRREPFYTEYYPKEEKDEFLKHLFRYHPWNQNSEERKQDLLAREGGYARSLVVNRYTCIGITNHHGKIFSDADNTVLKRFGAVLEQSYTRFLDLQKAEAQAREAQIEAALEKVRSRTMSMQKSDELAETAAVMFRQLISLGIEPNRLYIIIIKEESGEMEAWVTDEDGSRVSTGFTGNLNNNYSLFKMYEGWKKQLKTLIIDMQGEELQNYFHYLHEVLNVPFKGGLEQKRRVQHLAYFSKGLIGIASPEPQPAETLQLMERFAAVFNLTFTRFNDLKIAEAHALQAEQDLIAIKEAKKKAEEALTELQATQKQLIQAEKMASLGELTAGIAHEIQNPLNFVNNFSEINKDLLEEIKDQNSNVKNEELEDLLNDILQNNEKILHHGKRADAIVKGMLQHSRSSSGEKESTNINALADEYLRLAYHGLKAKDRSFNVSLKTDFDKNIGNINIIPQDIGRVLLNLINNAFYAVNEKKKLVGEGYEPEVTVSTKLVNTSENPSIRQSANSLMISVRDNGNGIPEKILDKIFQPFFTTKPTGQGTGLGLSLSYDIIQAHGGDLKVETREGQGTEFIIQLPISSN